MNVTVKRGSLFRSPVDTQWSSLCHSDKRLCDGGRAEGIASAVCTLQPPVPGDVPVS